MLELLQINSPLQIWKVTLETNGYLLVLGEQSLLIDCPTESLSEVLHTAGLPLPQIILHTQVQEEHCREWAAFPSAKVYVAEESLDVATHAEAFFRDISTEWSPSREWDSRGEEKYGVAGCVTERPPVQPLAVAGVLHPGQSFYWEGIELEVIGLIGSGKRSLGFFWRQQHILFSGDLLCAGGYLVNCYDIERSYGGIHGYSQLRTSLITVRDMNPDLLLPTSGLVIEDPVGDINLLLQRLSWVWNPPTRRGDALPALTNYLPRREFGRYREILPGLFQNNNSGNIILFINDEGQGLLIDPDPCVWLSWEENCREVHADFDLLEREAGLKRVGHALATHYHGDHVQYCDLLHKRYCSKILATPDVAAIMARPEKYPYPACIDWYGFPFKQIEVGGLLAYDTPFCWSGIDIMPFHAPGHCQAHAGFYLEWQGVKIACCGDALQYGNGPIQTGMPIIYNDTAWPEYGIQATLARLVQLRPQLLLGGHSYSFFDHDGAIINDFCAVAEESLRCAEAMVEPGTLQQAMTPIGYEKIRPQK